MTNKPYKPQHGSSAYRIMGLLKNNGEQTRCQIETEIDWREHMFGEHAIWHSLIYMVSRGAIKREIRFNPKTKRVASFYKISA